MNSNQTVDDTDDTDDYSEFHRMVRLDLEEWRDVDRVVRHFSPEPVSMSMAVTLSGREDRRVWTIHLPWCAVEVLGGPTDERDMSDVVWLPPRLIVHGAELAEIEPCDLVLGGTTVAVVSSLGSAHFARASGATDGIGQPGVRPEGLAAADLTVSQMTTLIGEATSAEPPGPTCVPDLWLSIGGGRVTLTVAYPVFGTRDVVVGTSAWTRGTAVVRLPHHGFRQVLGAFDPEADLRLEFDCDRRVLWLDSEPLSVAMALAADPSGAPSSPAPPSSVPPGSAPGDGGGAPIVLIP